jgi:iron complex outermembrane receptor protein
VRRITPLIVAAIGLAVASVPAVAQQDTTRRDTTRTRLAPVVIQGARQASTIGGASAVIFPLDSLRITPAAPLEDVLREMPFVLVRQNSRGESEVSVRGSDSRQAAILFDGMPVTLGWDSRADPSVFPLSGARSVQLVRGLSSLLQGPNTLGGVVEFGVVSYRAESVDRARLGLRAGFDQVGMQSYQLDAVRPMHLGSADVTLRAGIGFRDRPAVALSSDVRDQYSTNERRSNSDLSQLEGYFAARYVRSSGAWLGVSASGYKLDRGVMPELHIQAPRFWRYPTQDRTLALLSAGTGRRRTPLGAGDMEFVVGVNSGHTEIESFTNATYATLSATELGDERTTTARLLADHSLGRGELRTAFTLANISYDETLLPAPASRYSQRLVSGALEVDQPIVGTLRATAGWGLDVATNPETGGRTALGRLSEWGGRLGLSTLAGGRFRLHASASRRARFAALRELYSGALNRFEPNPALRPEVLTGAEVGATLLSAKYQFQAVGFVHRLDDAVVRITQPDRRFKRINRDRINSRGLELLGGVGLGNVHFSMDALVQHVRLVDQVLSGTERRPENQPQFRVGFDGDFPVIAGMRARVSMNHSGEQFCVNPDLSANQRLAPQTQYGTGIERSWNVASGLWSRISGSLQLENATDAAAYDQCGLPQPGRTLRFGIALH